MSFASSMTYVYAYVGFVCVYLAGSLVLATSAISASSRLSRTEPGAAGDTPGAAGLDTALGHGRRLIDYTQAATALPLVYIVASVLLGSLVARYPGNAGVVNVVWIALTAVCGGASLLLAVVAHRESARLAPPASTGTDARVTAEALQKTALRLGVSTALLLLVAAFTLLNMWSVLSDLGTLRAAGFLL